MKNEMVDLIHKHIQVWNETDRERRHHMIRKIYTPDCECVDPTDQIQGWDEIEELVEHLQSQFPGATFELVGDIDSHHHIARFSWIFGPLNSQMAPVRGMDIAISADGRIQALYGFFDSP